LKMSEDATALDSKTCSTTQQLDVTPVVQNRLEGPSTDYTKQNNSFNTSIITSNPSSDEGYESDVGKSNASDDTSSTKSKETPQSTPFSLSHELFILQKTQHFSKWLVTLAHTPENLKGGWIKARYINFPALKSNMSRSKITFQSNFYSRLQELNEGSSDGLAFAKALFCAKGILKKEHVSNDTCDLGLWDNELGNSGVLILHFVFVEKEFRRQGLARLLLQSIIEDTKKRTGNTGKGVVKFLVVFPAVVKDDFEDELEGKTATEKKDIEKKHYDRAVAFYRAMGFRRIGISKWFGLALDPQHRSRQVAIEDDLDIPEDSKSTLS
jgi:GNAT superfamily N-acetyltransferase